MKIDGITLQAKRFIKPKTPEPVEPEVEQTTQGSPLPAQIEEPQSEPQENDADKGVLRNLLAGHFKGVSDVRLRINFFEELAAIEAAEVQTVTAEKATGVLESVGGVVTTFLEPFLESENELTQKQMKSVSELHDTFIKAADESQNEPALDLTSAFGEFVKELENLFAPTAETTGFPWETFLEDLRTAFATAPDELTKAVTDLQILPELSEPNGNGVAYEKFLTIYNDLRGLNAPAAEQPVSEPVDVVV